MLRSTEVSKLNLEEVLWGQKLKSVSMKYNTIFKPCYDEILVDEVSFEFETKTLRVIPLIDSDEIRLELDTLPKQGRKKSSKQCPLSHYIGCQLTTTWECTHVWSQRVAVYYTKTIIFGKKDYGTIITP